MAKVAIGKIESIEGSVEVVHADGTTGSLQLGAAVYADDAITTDENSSLRIKFLDDSGMNIGPEFTAILHKGIFDPALIEEDDTTSQVVLQTSDREITPDSGQDTEANAEEIGTVEATEGVVEAVGDDGKARVLQAGDTLYANDVIRVASDGNVSIRMVDGSELSFGPGTTARMDASDSSPQIDVEEPGLTDPVQIQTAIQEGRDPTQEAAAPAAGEAGGGNEGGVPVILTASTRAVTPDSGHDTHGQGLPFNEPDQDLLVPIEPVNIPTVIVTYNFPNLSGSAGVADEKGLPGLPSRPADKEGSGEIVNPPVNDDPSETTTGDITVNTGTELLAKLEVLDALGVWVNVTTGTTVVTGDLADLIVTETAGVYTWEYTLPDNLAHPDSSTTDGDGDRGADDSLRIEEFKVRATDESGDVSPEKDLNIDAYDDGPVVDAAKVAAADVLNVDESDLLTDDTANFADNFSTAIVYGADGPGSTVYSLGLSAPLVGSGLYAVDSTDTSTVDGDGYGQGAEILLQQTGINEITGSVGGTDYYTITVNPATGEVEVDQLAAVWHADTTNPDDVSTLTTTSPSDLTLTATVTDGDGDKATHAISLGTSVFNIDDDGPTLTLGTIPPGPPVTITATVHEDSLSIAAGDAGDLSEGIREGQSLTDDEASSAASGSLTALVTANPGEDGLGTLAFKLVNTAVATPLLPTLFSNGDALSYSVSPAGDVLTATADDGTGPRTVFTLTVNPDGSWDFDLDDQLDHVVDGNPLTDGDDETTLLTAAGPLSGGIDFTAIVTATLTDADGDTASLASLGGGTGSFIIEVANDIPTLTLSSTPTNPVTVTATVHEDSLSTTLGDAGDLSEGIREGQSLTDDEASSAASGSLTALVTASAGADEPGSPTFKLLDNTAVNATLPTLYSNGEALEYSVVTTPATPTTVAFDTLTATSIWEGIGEDIDGNPVVPGNPAEVNVNGVTSAAYVARDVFILTVDTDGTWDFDLDDQLDHVDDGNAANGEGDTETALFTAAGPLIGGINFTAIVTATLTDADGDTASLASLAGGNGAFTIVVENDVPEAVPGTAKIHVDEDELAIADGDLVDGITDGDAETDEATFMDAALQALVNSGADEPVTFSLNTSVAGNVLTTGGVAVTSGGINVVYNYNAVLGVIEGVAGTDVIFTLTDNGDKTFTFDLMGNMDHTDPTDDEEIITLALTDAFIGEDADNDPVLLASDAIQVEVENDIAAAGQVVTIRVDEDDLAVADGDLVTGIPDGDADTDEATFTDADMQTLIDPGAGGPVTYSLNTSVTGNVVTIGDVAVTSGGVNVVYSNNAGVIEGIAGTAVIFTLTDNGDKTFTFDLLGQIDHTALPINDDNEVLTLDLTNAFNNDAGVTLNDDQIRVEVENDIPTLTSSADPMDPLDPSVLATVHEDGLDSTVDELPTGAAGNDLSDGNLDPGTSTDSDEASNTTSGAASLTTLVTATIGADEPGSPTFKLLDNTAVNATLPTLYSNGEALEYSVVTTPATPTTVAFDTLTATSIWEGIGEDIDGNPVASGNPAEVNVNGVTSAAYVARDVFTLTVRTDGTWDFDLDDQLDHVVDSDPLTDGDEETTLYTGAGNPPVTSIDFTAVVTAAIEDADGDIVSDTLLALGAADGSFAITVENDIPTLTSSADPMDPLDPSVLATVHEDGLDSTVDELPTGAAGNDLSDGNLDPGTSTDSDEASNTTSGAASLTTLVTAMIGADEPGSPTFKLLDNTAVNATLPTLYSNGEALEYSVVTTPATPTTVAFDTLTATSIWEGIGEDIDGNPVASGNPAEVNVNGVTSAAYVARDVFILTVRTDGTWDFDLDDQLDHVVDSDPLTDGDEETTLYTGAGNPPVTSIDFTAVVTAAIEDADGDIVSDTLLALGAADGSFAITVENDIPTLTSSADPMDPLDPSVLATVHEDGLDSTVDELPTGAAGNDLSDGNLDTGTSTDSDEASNTTSGAASLTTLVTAMIGADEPGSPTFKLLDNTAVNATLPTLYSNGEALEYSVVTTPATPTTVAFDTLTATSIWEGIGEDIDGNPVASGNPAEVNVNGVTSAAYVARDVFILTVRTDGTWDFDLDDQLDHVVDSDPLTDGDEETTLYTGAGNPPVTSIDFTAVVTAAIEDADGDIVSDTLLALGAADGSFAITVENDIPTLTSTTDPMDPTLSVIATVHEDGMSTTAVGAVPADSSEGNLEGTLTTSSDEASDATGGAGSLTTLVTATVGADEPGSPTFKLVDSAAVTLALPALFSNGDLLVYEVNTAGDTLTAKATDPAGATRTVFILTVDTSGTWDFDLQDQLDHIDDGDALTGAGDTETALETIGGSVVGIDFTAIVTASIEDADGDIVSDTLTGLGAADGSFAITVENDIPVISGTNSGTGPVSATVHEDGLSTMAEPGDSSEGIREGGLDTTSDEASGAAGSLATLLTVNDGADEPTTDPAFGLVSNVTGLLPALFSHGDAVTYGVSGDTLTATADDGSGVRTVFTLKVNTDGSWDFDLDDQLDHVDASGDTGTALVTGAGSISEIDFSSIITVTVTDFDGDMASVTGLDAGDFTIAVENDIPTATPVVNSGEAIEAIDTNLMLILDVSGSMGNSANFDGMTRLEVMIKSSLELLEQYDAFGDVMVNIVTFSTAATNPNGVWVDIEAAKDVLLALTDGGGTNYDRALGEAIRAFGESGKIDPAVSTVPVQNISYFMSDGVPTYGAEDNTDTNPPWDEFDGDLQGNGSSTTSSPDNGIQTPEQDQWEAFLITNNIVSWALGMGMGVTEANLVPIGYDGTIPDDLDPIVVDDFADLEATLLSTIEAPPLSGEIISGGGGSGGAAVVGADEGGWLQSFTVFDVNGLNPVVYSYDQLTDIGSNSVVPPDTDPYNGTFDDATNEWTVTTAALASLKVDMDTGAYTYTPPSPLTGAINEVFGYTVIDRDGDTASSTATLSIDAAAGLAVVRDDFVITNQDPTVIPHAALLANDTPANGFDQSLTGVSSPDNGTITDNSNDPVDPVDTVTFDGTGAADQSFVYTNTSGSNSDTAVVDVDQVTGTDLTGSYLDEILIGGSANETLDGGAGDDVLVGAGGDNILTGGAAADTFLYVEGDTGADEITDFVVTDTDPDTHDDVLNIADLLNDMGALDGLDDAAMTAALDGQYVSIAAGTDTVVSIFSDGSGTGTPDQVIQLTGYSTTGTSADIIASLLAGDNLVAE